MKKLYFLMAVLFLGVRLAAQSNYSDYSLKEDFDRYFHGVDLNRTHTGNLYDKSIHFFDLKFISQDRRDDSSLVASHHLPFLYATLLMSGINDDSGLPDHASVYGKTYGNLTPANVIPLSVVAWQFDYLKADALSSGAMYIQDSVLFDGNMAIDPYEVDTAFAVVPQLFSLAGNSFRFCMYGNTMLNNLDYPFDSIRIDFGDGLGWRRLRRDIAVQVAYSSAGTKYIRSEVTLPDGHTLRAHAAVEVTLPAPPNQSSPPSGPPTTYDIKHPATLRMTADKTYLGTPGTCELNIFFACADHKLRKPFILLDGFDPTPHANNVTYKDIFYENKLGITKKDIPVDFDFGYDALFAEGYDLVFVDWVDKYKDTLIRPIYEELHDSAYNYYDVLTGYDTVLIRDQSQRPGNDYIQRNAYTVEKVIKWANAEKHKNNSSAPTVLAGMSMGGIVANTRRSTWKKRATSMSWRMSSPLTQISAYKCGG